jgi:glutaredoxin
MTFTLYSKADCSLCDKAKDALAEFRRECVFDLIVTDISTDPALFEKYKYDIPVLALNGADVVKHFIDIKKMRVVAQRGKT